MAGLSLSLLGPFKALLDEQPLTHFRTRSVQALLIYLTVEAGSTNSHAREAIAELLWPGLPPASAKKNLRQTLYELRQTIPQVATRDGSVAPFVLSDRQVMSINPDCMVDLDVTRFNRKVKEEGITSLTVAADLYRGEFLVDFYLPDSEDFEAWVAARRAHYRRLALDTLNRLSEHHLEQRAFREAELFARRQLEMDDLRESAVRQLMRALAGRGERSAALAQYETSSELLRKELQIEPEAGTKALFQQIHLDTLEPAVESPAGSAPTAAWATARADRHNLPIPATPFIGREEELAEVERLLLEDPSCRLLVLLGPGGYGKTRLAIQVASHLTTDDSDPFPDGIWFVPLAPAGDPAAIVPAIASTLRLTSYAGGGEPLQQLFNYLRDKQMLLLLDNMEHLLGEDTGHFLASFLEAAPRLKLLITSRIRPNLQGEQLFPLAGLQTPASSDPGDDAASYSGVRLFMESARRIRPEMSLESAEMPTVVRICQMVQGMPLAIELAASWVAMLSPTEIADEISRGLDFLEGDWHDLPERHRSLRAVFDTSWTMLTPAERETLKGMSIFVGGFTRHAALSVTGASLRDLLALVNKSWLVRDENGRYQIHELLCQYSGEKLWQAARSARQVQGAHARYYSAFLSELGETMKGPGQDIAFEQVAAEFENMRLAWNWLLESGRLDVAMDKMLPGFFLFCGATGRASAMLSLVRAAQSGQGDETTPTNQAILTVAEMAFYPEFFVIRSPEHFIEELPMESTNSAWQILRSALPERVPGLWLILSATLYGWRADRDEAIGRLRELEAVYRRQGTQWLLASSLANVGRLRGAKFPLLVFDEDGTVDEDAEKARKEETRQAILEAANIFQSLGDRLEWAYSLKSLGSFLNIHNPAEAVGYLRQAKPIIEAAGDQVTFAQILENLGTCALWLGDFEKGLALLGEMQQVYEDLGNSKLVAGGLTNVSLKEVRYGRIGRARRLRARALAIHRSDDDLHFAAWDLWELGDIERFLGNVGAARRLYDEAFALFDRYEDQLGIAYYHRGLAEIALDQRDYAEAESHFRQALELARRLGHDWSVTYMLCGLGRARTELGQYQMAHGHFLEALQLERLLPWPDLTMITLAGLSSLFAVTGQPERAVELATFVQSQPISWQETKMQAAAVLDAARAKLPADIADAAEERGHQRDLETIFSEILSAS